MPELLDITQLILKHLPPSADLPRVRPLDDRSARWCLALDRQGSIISAADQSADATVASDIAHVQSAVASLRPNGRAIFLIPNTEGIATESIIEALTSNDLTRILTESVLDHTFILARGERPTDQSSPLRYEDLRERTTDRIATMAQIESTSIEILNLDQAVRCYPHLHLLVKQDPPSRGWDDMPPDTIWDAMTVHDAQSNQNVLLAFTSLVKAVAFMQPAVLAGVIHGVNKLPRFETERIIGGHLLIINPVFERLREDQRFNFDSPSIEIDPALAMKSNE
jgi:hypothetical protein